MITTITTIMTMRMMIRMTIMRMRMMIRMTTIRRRMRTNLRASASLPPAPTPPPRSFCISTLRNSCNQHLDDVSDNNGDGDGGSDGDADEDGQVVGLDILGCFEFEVGKRDWKEGGGVSLEVLAQLGWFPGPRLDRISTLDSAAGDEWKYCWWRRGFMDIKYHMVITFRWSTRSDQTFCRPKSITCVVVIAQGAKPILFSALVDMGGWMCHINLVPGLP